MHDFGMILNNANKDGHIKGAKCDRIWHADDLCLISITSSGMQTLLNICELYGRENDLIYNNKKSVSGCFKTNFKIINF